MFDRLPSAWFYRLKAAQRDLILAQASMVNVADGLMYPVRFPGGELGFRLTDAGERQARALRLGRAN